VFSTTDGKTRILKTRLPSTVNRFRPVAAILGLFLLTTGVGLGIRSWFSRARVASDGASAPSVSAGSRSLLSATDSQRALAAGDAPPAPTEPIAARVAPLMTEWRSAIVNKNADMVESLDRTFVDHPREFIPALMASAESDPEDRVRSFSTRVLGKLRPSESTELMRKLLSDRSEYVRFNAAWALGQLADREAGPRLRRLLQRDPSATVRQSARESLSKIEGG
jgi:HEAT repeats